MTDKNKTPSQSISTTAKKGLAANVSKNLNKNLFSSMSFRSKTFRIPVSGLLTIALNQEAPFRRRKGFRRSATWSYF